MQANRQNNDHLMIVIPLSEGRPSRLLGACDELALFEVDARKKRVLYESVHKAPPHEPGLIPSRLRQLGVDVVLAGEMGHLARRMFSQAGIGVVTNVPPKAPGQLVHEYLNGQLTRRDNPHGGPQPQQCAPQFGNENAVAGRTGDPRPMDGGHVPS
jgi:predicted Fe-Mo cluster-binding NifX family protein